MMGSSFVKRRHPTKVALTAGLLASCAAIQGAHAADADHPTVVELFQSQGCSSCPPANANVMALADRPDLLTLSWQVTYWDSLGWKDTFGDPAFTSRQYDYAHAFGRTGVFTPEIVVNGRSDVVGSDRGPLNALIVRNDRGDIGPAVSIDAAAVHVTGPAPVPGTLVELVRYDPSIIAVPIRRGENGGRTLPHRNVVRQVAVLGDWTGGSTTYAIPPGDTHLKTAILVQAGLGGPILAARVR